MTRFSSGDVAVRYVLSVTSCFHTMEQMEYEIVCMPINGLRGSFELRMRAKSAILDCLVLLPQYLLVRLYRL